MLDIIMLNATTRIMSDTVEMTVHMALKIVEKKS